jgi:hypothetical protein
LGPNTRTEAALGSIGFWEMEANIDKAKVIYFGRLCMLGPETTTKQVFINRLFSLRYRQGEERVTGFIPDMMRLLQKYNLQEFLETYINDQYFPRKAEWRKKYWTKLADINCPIGN